MHTMAHTIAHTTAHTSTKTILMAALGAVMLSAAAWADPGPAPKTSKPSSPTTITTGSLTVTTGRGSESTGGNVNEPTAAQRMSDCMAIWEPRTHMSKAEWRRSCSTTLQSLTGD